MNDFPFFDLHGDGGPKITDCGASTADGDFDGVAYPCTLQGWIDFRPRTADDWGVIPSERSGLGFDVPLLRAEKFWSRVDMTAGHTGGCWPYRVDAPGRRGRYGHVRIRFAGHDVIASRLAFVLAGGVIDDQVVCHSCDNGGCAYPAHLSCTSIAENNRQRDERNRRTPFLPRGADSAAAKLTVREVEAIHRARAGGVPVQTVAAIFGVSRATVYNVLSGRFYGDTGMPRSGS